MTCGNKLETVEITLPRDFVSTVAIKRKNMPGGHFPSHMKNKEHVRVSLPNPANLVKISNGHLDPR